MLAAGMFVSVGERQEREEYLVVPAEILGDHARAAVDVVENSAVMLHHAARRAAGDDGVDKAGAIRSEEGGVGKDGVRRGGSGWWRDEEKKNERTGEQNANEESKG